MDNDEKESRKEWGRPPAWKPEEEIRDRVMRDVHDRINRKMRNRMRNRDSYGGLVPGAILLAIGLVFLLDRMGYISVHHYLHFWPLIIIAVGLAKIARNDSRVWGALILLFGVFLQLNELGIGHFTWGEFWPLLLIVAGLMAMWSALQARKIMSNMPAAQSTDPRTALDESTIFGGIQKRVNTKQFQGGRLHAIFGGIEIDLRDADIAEHEAVIYANAIFGGIEIRVPDTWYVAARGQGVFGGYSDATHYAGPGDADNPRKTLVVLGAAVFGGVEIRN